MSTKKAVQWIAIAFVAFYLLSQPTNAAHTVNVALQQLGNAGNALGRFLNQLGK